MNVTGESFDYGPWRFLAASIRRFTAAYFDQTGLYAFGRQPEALHWNLARLGECLLPISSRGAIEPSFDSFAARFQAALTIQTFARLGLAADPLADQPLVRTPSGRRCRKPRPPFQQAFHDLLGGGDPARLRASPIRATFETAGLGRGDRRPARAAPAPGLDAARAHPRADARA